MARFPAPHGLKKQKIGTHWQRGRCFQSPSHGGGNPKRNKLMKQAIFLATIATVAGLLPAQAQKKAKTPEQACQGQALNSIARAWPNVLRGQFEIIVKDKRCLVFLQAPAVFEGKRTAWLIDGRTGDLLSEFYAPTGGGAWKDADRGLCSYRGGKFPTGDCTWDEYLDKIDRM